jgi:hypothetical protein
MKLDKSSLCALLQQLDDAAEGEPISKDQLIIIGSSALILQGMDYRQTIDVDFWQTTIEAKSRVRQLSGQIGIDFDPDDYADREEPYIQWVNPRFVHMPVDETWKNHTKIAWAGKNIVINSAPMGVILGSKLAAGRRHDMDDIRYIVTSFKSWREELDLWAPRFSKKDQETINENRIFADLFESEASSLSSKKSTSRKNSK